MSAGRLIFLIGGSGTGKTTLARELQERLLPEQWFHFSPDTVLYGLAKSVVDRADFANDWSAIDVALVRKLAYGLVHNALQSGGRVVFDCVLMTERGATELLTAFEARNPFLVGTTCDWDELVRRTTVRGDRTLAEVQRGFETNGKFLDVDRVLDTTDRSPEESVDLLLRDFRRPTGASAWRRNLERYRIGT